MQTDDDPGADSAEDAAADPQRAPGTETSADTDNSDGSDSDDAAGDPKPVVVASGLGVDGEHGPLFSGVDLALMPGFHAVQMPGGPAQSALLLTLAGRVKATHGTVSVCGDTEPRAIRRHCAIAAFEDIDDLEESVTVNTVVDEQLRWLAPWYSRVPDQAAEPKIAEVFGDIPAPAGNTFIVELSDLELFLLRVTLALLSNRPILVVGDLEQVRDNSRRVLAVQRLGILAEHRTVIVGVTNPLGLEAPDHDLHDHRILNGGN